MLGKRELGRDETASDGRRRSLDGFRLGGGSFAGEGGCHRIELPDVKKLSLQGFLASKTHGQKRERVVGNRIGRLFAALRVHIFNELEIERIEIVVAAGHESANIAQDVAMVLFENFGEPHRCRDGAAADDFNQRLRSLIRNGDFGRCGNGHRSVIDDDRFFDDRAFSSVERLFIDGS